MKERSGGQADEDGNSRPGDLKNEQNLKLFNLLFEILTAINI